MNGAHVHHLNRILATGLGQHGITARVVSHQAPLEITGLLDDGRALHFHARNGTAWLGIGRTSEDAVNATIGHGPGDAMATKCPMHLTTADTDVVFATFERLLPLLVEGVRPSGAVRPPLSVPDCRALGAIAAAAQRHALVTRTIGISEVRGKAERIVESSGATDYLPSGRDARDAFLRVSWQGYEDWWPLAELVPQWHTSAFLVHVD